MIQHRSPQGCLHNTGKRAGNAGASGGAGLRGGGDLAARSRTTGTPAPGDTRISRPLSPAITRSSCHGSPTLAGGRTPRPTHHRHAHVRLRSHSGITIPTSDMHSQLFTRYERHRTCTRNCEPRHQHCSNVTSSALVSAHPHACSETQQPTLKFRADVKLGRKMSPINYVGKSRHFVLSPWSGFTAPRS